MFKKVETALNVIKSVTIIAVVVIAGIFVWHKYAEIKILNQIIERLEADSRIAEVLVTDSLFDKITGKTMTTIKFLEYDSKGKPLTAKFFTFSDNIIQFQSLVIRFDDKYVRKSDKLRGKSIYLFWKVFMLDGANTQEYVITPINEVPNGYKIENCISSFEKRLWSKFWDYALNPECKKLGVKNTQIEAPGTKFVPGILYTIKIEHDGGIRIDASKIPDILQDKIV